MQVAIGYSLVTLARLDEATPWVEQGIAALEPLGEGADLARALETLGNLLRRRGSPVEAEAPLRRAMEMAGRVDAPVVQAHAAISLGIDLLHLGRVPEGIALSEEGWELANRAGDLDLLLRAHNSTASVLMDFAPDYPRGRRLLQEGIELSQRSGRRDHEAWMWGNVANYAFDQGRMDEIEQASEMCFEIGRSQSNPYALATGIVTAALVAFLQGDLDAAERGVQEGMRLLDPHEESQVVPFEFLPLGWISRARGDDEDELRWYLEGLEIVGDDVQMGMVDELLSETVRALVRRDRPSQAQPHLDTLRRVSRDRPNAEAFLWWAEGVAEGDPEKLRAAAERFAELTRPIDHGRVLLELADLGLDPDANRARARELFAGSGATVYVRQIPGGDGATSRPAPTTERGSVG
jgi:tetratricopeptide (TPR) repeat protein